MSLKVTKDITGSVMKAFKGMGDKHVLIGVPAKNDPREDDPIGNAQIARIQEFGSPAQNIPARPFLIPGVRAAKEDCAKILKVAANQSLSGNTTAMETGLSRAGQKARSSVQMTMKKGAGYKPLALSTLKARLREHKGRKGLKAEIASRESGNVPNNSNVRPLLDTDQLLNSITYVVRDH